MTDDAMSYPEPRDDHHADFAANDGDDVENAAADEDGVVYPVEETVGETGPQQIVILGLMLPLRDYFEAQRRDVLVSTDQFILYRRGDPTAAVSPDLYIIDAPNETLDHLESWKLWEHDGKAPQLAIEVVSDATHAKDYDPRTLARYQDLGLHELIRYDAEIRPDHRGLRRMLTHWVRDPDGVLRERPIADNRIRSDYFGFWLIPQPDRTLRMSPDGVTLWPTPTEQVTAARAEARAEAERRLEADQRAAAADQRAAAADRRAADADAEIQRLRAELTRSRTR